MNYPLLCLLAAYQINMTYRPLMLKNEEATEAANVIAPQMFPS